MKKSNGSVRMGPISLVTLVIVLCLAVMCILSVTTARAMLLATERQASATSDVYICEQAGQEFLANVDGVLASVRGASSDGSGDGSYEGVDDYADAEGYDNESYDSAAGEATDEATDEAATEEASIDTSDTDLEIAAGEGENSNELAFSEQTVEGTDLRSSALTALREAGNGLINNIEVEGVSSAVDIATNDDSLPSLTATFVTASSRRLSITIAINDDATYRILSWKTTTFWNNNTSTDTLWSGDATD